MTAAPEFLPNGEWIKAPPLSTVLAALNRGEAETRIVGGAVRDALLGRPHGDVDCATTASTDEITAMAEANGLKAVPTGVAHGTVTVIADGRPFEVTTLRHDVETHGRHATVAFGADWDEDAHRRDFTMNALYVGRDGRLYDPVGGYGDLLARRVRFIGAATARIREDFLRILRFFRFHAQFAEGPPDPDGLTAAIHERRGLLGLSGERLRQELFRLLAAPGAPATVAIMAECGILGIVTGGVPYGRAFVRAVANEAAAGETPDPVRRLAALAVAVPEDAERLSDRLRLSNAERRRLGQAADGWWHVSPDLPDRARRALLYRVGIEAYRDRVALAFARSGAAADEAGWRDLMDLPDRWKIPQFPIKGADLMRLGLPSGPEIGRLLSRLEADWIAEDFGPDRDALLARAAKGRGD
ncbi:CCA tRNA nucleotidyltransferase [Microbaculum sp. FT89]|uniref:CCA tRNA nucleotidyltransferase n=1 Tax=Microbaculum sp. FT89 TaxID=3447298 RepID=UPI003F52A8FD